MNKEQITNGTTKKQEEFDRSVCMSFYNDHRQLVKRIERLHGIEMAYKIQNAIIDYGLDGIAPEDEEILQFIPEPVLNQIDGNQKRRARSFKGEDLDISRSIILLHRDHPEMSQNAIMKTLGVSKGKVNKTLQKYKNGEYEGIINLDDSTLTITSTNTNTSTTTSTYMTDDQRDRMTTCLAELADAQTDASLEEEKEEKKEKKETYKSTKRILEDLTDDELINLHKDFQRGIPYVEMQKKYNLFQNVTNSQLGNNIKNIQEQRHNEKERIVSKENISRYKEELFKYPEKKEKLKMFTECKSDEELLQCIMNINRNPDDILAFYEDNIDTKNQYDEPALTRWIWKLRESGRYSTYEYYIQKVMDSSGYSKSA